MEAEKSGKEKNEQHSQIIKLKEEIDLKDTKWRSSYRVLEDEINDTKFALSVKEKELMKKTEQVLF